MSTFALTYDRTDPSFENFPDYVLDVGRADEHTAQLRRRHHEARKRAEDVASARRTRNEGAAGSWFLASVACLVLAGVFAIFVWFAALPLLALAGFCIYVSFTCWRGAVASDQRRADALDAHYAGLIEISKQADQAAERSTERARKRYRAWWQAFREGEGGFDAYLLEELATMPDKTGTAFYQRLQSDFEAYYDFLRLSVVSGISTTDTDGTPVPMLAAFQAREREDRAAVRPVTLRERREANEAHALEIFATHQESDEDVARFLASRARDGGELALAKGVK